MVLPTTIGFHILEQIIEVSKDFQHYEVEFEMKERTDKKTILSISMGAVNDVQINKKHTVTLDNFVLEEVK